MVLVSEWTAFTVPSSDLVLGFVTTNVFENERFIGRCSETPLTF